MRKLFITAIFLAMLWGCSAPAIQPDPAVPSLSAHNQFPTDPDTLSAADAVALYLSDMSTEEKVGQLFLARYRVNHASSAVEQYHVGGLILFSSAFRYDVPVSLRARLADLQRRARIPLLMAVDEEGGDVTRISRYPQYRAFRFPAPRSLYQKGGIPLLTETEAEKCALLSALGLNVNMGPVCDITTDPSAFMYERSLGLEPENTAAAIAAMVNTMTNLGIGSVLKHFPGYGNNVDTHIEIARDSRSLEALEAFDLVPFRAGIDTGCGAILISHTIVEALDSSLPASLSPAVLSYLRNEMGFDGVCITDDLIMEAITDAYGTGEAAVLAVLAGNDLLCSTEYEIQYEAVLSAVREGRIPMERIDEAVTRVLRWKQQLGLLEF